jgi:hypothetical protein
MKASPPSSYIPGSDLVDVSDLEEHVGTVWILEEGLDIRSLHAQGVWGEERAPVLNS